MAAASGGDEKRERRSHVGAVGRVEVEIERGRSQKTAGKETLLVDRKHGKL